MDNVINMQNKLHLVYKEAMMNPATQQMVADLAKVFGFNGPSIADKGNPNALQALYKGATRDVLNRVYNYSNPEFFEKKSDLNRTASNVSRESQPKEGV